MERLSELVLLPAAMPLAALGLGVYCCGPIPAALAPAACGWGGACAVRNTSCAMLYALLLSALRTSVNTCENGRRTVPVDVYPFGFGRDSG